MPAYRNNNHNPKSVRINFEVEYIKLTQPIKKACHLVWKVSIDFPVQSDQVDVLSMASMISSIFFYLE